MRYLRVMKELLILKEGSRNRTAGDFHELTPYSLTPFMKLEGLQNSEWGGALGRREISPVMGIQVRIQSMQDSKVNVAFVHVEDRVSMLLVHRDALRM
mmetsp:Transcript_13558/g.27729  ORF Transcript_13558/g.27729 Transcript_13558/m.27729 type:complete len:98 (+) Transcript_13558:51-344(+)